MPSETEAGEEDEVDVCTVERIPALCSRYSCYLTQSQSALILESYFSWMMWFLNHLCFFFFLYLYFRSDEENDEDPDSIYYLPVAPEIDDPEETGWTQEVWMWIWLRMCKFNVKWYRTLVDLIVLQFSQNDVHPTGVERKRSATQESSSESQKKKIKVIDIRNGSSEQESKSHGGFNCVAGLA